MRPDKEDACIACGHCMAFCPSGAARVDVLPVDDMLPIDRKLLPSAEQAEMLIKTRRSTRRFKPEPVPRELLQRVLAATRHAPSAKNGRPVRYIVAHERDTLKRIGDCAVEWLAASLTSKSGPAMPEAGALARAWRSGLDPLFRGAPHLVLAVAEKTRPWAEGDSAIALTYLEMAALVHGIGACWAGYVTHAARQYEPLQRLLGVQEHEAVQGGQMLGFISLRPTASAPRTPFPEHWLDGPA